MAGKESNTPLTHRRRGVILASLRAAGGSENKHCFGTRSKDELGALTVGNLVTVVGRSAKKPSRSALAAMCHNRPLSPLIN